MSMQEPKILKILEESGELSDELDYMVNNHLMAERGMGYTACSPSLVEIEYTGNPKQVIKMGIDHTFVDVDSGQVMGYGIVGYLFFQAEPFEVLYITPTEDLESKVTYILESGMEASERPKGKY
ncbi:MAG: hypothetical protein EU530_01935 [Promethearchaeota archaeon]|nr:MAG: hypothetical protein EU530_01935 [Candidatus Lokiarchaeota archaeon]